MFHTQLKPFHKWNHVQPIYGFFSLSRLYIADNPPIVNWIVNIRTHDYNSSLVKDKIAVSETTGAPKNKAPNIYFSFLSYP